MPIFISILRIGEIKGAGRGFLCTMGLVMCSTTPSAIERRKVYYSGQVQGVGFRYTAQHVARRYDVAGFVRNLPDGRVELVVEGACDQLKRFFDDITEALNGYISSTEVLASSATGEFEGFGIRY